MIDLDRIVSAIGNIARPYVLYSAATSSALATVMIPAMKMDLSAGALFVGAAWGGTAALYAAKAMETASVAKTNAAPAAPDSGQPAQ